MGNHRENIFWPLKFPNPNCTLCHKNDRDTWPHLLSMCEHPYLKGLSIARHNKAVHLITQTLQANKHTKYYTLTNAGTSNNNRQEQTVPEWLIECTCTQTKCQCHAKHRPNILCYFGASNHTSTPLLPSNAHTIQFMEFTYCHDRFPEQAITQQQAKYDPLINAIQNKRWKVNPLITITAGVRGAIHEQPIHKIDELNIPKTIIKNLMKNIHQNAIKYLTYIVLNKRKLDNKQPPLHLPNSGYYRLNGNRKSPPPQRGITSHATTQLSRVLHLGIGLTFMPVLCTSVLFFFFLFLE